MQHKRLILLLCAVCFAAWFKSVQAKVVISEVMWMGSDLSTADEWLEIVGMGSGTGSEVMDISGWYITNQSSIGEEKTIVTFASGTLIGSGQYLLISNYNASGSRLAVEPDIVTTAVSLANTKLLLKLYDASGSLIDIVDDGIGVPFAGMNASGSGVRASMERVNLSGSGNVKEHWGTAETSIGFDSGAILLGTPSFPNGTGVRVDSGSGSGPETGSGEVMTGSGSTNSGVILTGTGSTGSGDILVTGTGSTQSGSVMTGVALPPVYITEVLANPIGKDDEEWIEVGNLGSGTVNIAGWILDEGNSPDHFVIPDTGSGFLLGSGTHIAFPKSVTGLPLDNKGEVLSLFSGSLLIDSWAYPETAEQVSFGRFGSGALQAFCAPTRDKPNQILPSDVSIGIQSHNGSEAGSGVIVGEGKLSINLEATSRSGSLASVECQWDYGDGFLSESCNPPSHAFSKVGEYEITMNAQDYCGTTVIQSVPIKVLQKAKKSSGGGGGSVQKEACKPSAYEGVFISEFLPNPYGEEKDEEWIELVNSTDQTVQLCGWILDDAEEGSKPYTLDGEHILPGQFLLLPRLQTGIALNNNGDDVRLGVMVSPSNHAPFDELRVTSGDVLWVDQVSFQKSIEGESFGLREDGNFVWTPFLTPEKENQLRSAQRRFPTDTVVVSAALPNPAGKDAEGEWIEIANVSEETVNLTGWFLDIKDGGSKPFSLDGVILQSNEERRFAVTETGINLVNSKDIVRILDPDKYTVSVFGWTEAVEGRIYRRPVIVTERMKAKVVNVVDGDTIDIIPADIDQLPRIPPSAKRRWLGIQVRDNPSIRLRLIGIDTPETVHPSKEVQAFGKEASAYTTEVLEGQIVEVEFDQELWDKYDRLLGYVYKDQESIQSRLLRNGLAYTYLRFPFIRKEEFLLLEQEAREAKLGLWSNGEVDYIIQELTDDLIEELSIQEDGLQLEVDPPSGLVASGTIVRFTPSVSANLHLSINSGAYTSFSGSYRVTENVELRVYAERMGKGTGSGSVVGSGDVLRTEALTASYFIEQKKYSTGAVISEVFPSPNSEEKEWVELYNTTDEDIPLAGWILDDVQEGGSKPWTIPGEHVLSAHSYLVLTEDDFGIGLNNAGDEVWLISPDGEVVASVDYLNVKKGQSVVLSGVEGQTRHSSTPLTMTCLTDVPTPGTRNICRQKSFTKPKRGSKIEQKLYTKRSPTSKPKWKVRYKNIAPWLDSKEDQQEIPASHTYLASFLEQKGDVEAQPIPSTPMPSEKTILVTITSLGTLLMGSRRIWPLN